MGTNELFIFYFFFIKVSGADELLLLQETALDNHLKSASLTVGAAFSACFD